MPESLPHNDDDEMYEALLAALSANARGRAFLDEHARRARANDIAQALAALARIEERLNAPAAALLPELENPAEHRPEPLRASPPADEPSAGFDVIAQVMAMSPEERIALFS